MLLTTLFGVTRQVSYSCAGQWILNECDEDETLAWQLGCNLQMVRAVGGGGGGGQQGRLVVGSSERSFAGARLAAAALLVLQPARRVACR